ncbi:mannosyl-oligosaccharide 1,2-alpha-mannosidase [Aureococcus anophagefferens]|nr:mannosyl-oligosaccharide 1,2-alpha-mannosidase [Aureococcus anophagefferens]
MDRSIDSMMAWFCARRDCGRPVAPAAVAAGLPVTASHLAASADDLARAPAPPKLKVTALRLFMHPGKTAGRAIAAALDAVDDIYVLGHDGRCDGSTRRATPPSGTPRTASPPPPTSSRAARPAWLPAVRCHHYLLGKRIGEILTTSRASTATASSSTRRASNATLRLPPLTWWVDGHEANIDFLCYDSLGDEFGDILRPYCGDGHCPELPRKNPSDHSKVLGPDGDRHLPALRRFVESLRRRRRALPAPLPAVAGGGQRVRGRRRRPRRLVAGAADAALGLAGADLGA